MMRFHEAMKLLEEGKSVRAQCWEPHDYINLNTDPDWAAIGLLQLLKEEWELYEEPERTLSFFEIVQGLKEGKKFKRKGWGNWYLAYSLSTYIQGTGIPMDFVPFNIENFEATDWIEVK